MDSFSINQPNTGINYQIKDSDNNKEYLNGIKESDKSVGILPSLETECPIDCNDILKRGLTINRYFDFVEDYYKSGTLPFQARQVSNLEIEKSITQKYPQYSKKQFVDVKHRSLDVWNLVGNGEDYPDHYESGVLVRPGCGHLWKDEGLGCLHSEKHRDNKIFVKLIVNTCMRPQCPICYEKWASREAFRIDERFRRVPKLLDCRTRKAEDRTPWGVPGHWVVAVPELEASLMDTR